MSWFALLVSITAALAASAAGAAERAEYGPYRVAAVELRDFAGELTVRIAADDAVRLALEAEERDLASFEVEERGDRLVLRGPRRSRSSTVVVGDVTVFSSGGDASVVIGGTPSGPGGPPPRLEMRVPRGTPLVLAGLAGEVDIADTEGPVELELSAGTARIGRVGAARIVVRGSGEVRVAEVRERLEAVIDGSGLVEVADGRVERLSATIGGSGAIRFDGTARRARAEILGAGTIAIREVLEPPEISILGAGSVDIAKRP